MMPARLSLLVLSMLLAVPALGAELKLQTRFATDYDSNLFGNNTDEKGGFTLNWRPTVEFSDRVQRFDYRLRYSPLYRYFPEESADSWSHDILGTVNVAITPKLRLSASDRFSRLDNVDFDFFFPQAGDPANNVPDSEFDNKRTKANRAEASLNWQFTGLDSLNLSISHNWRSFDDEFRGDNTLFRGSLTYQRRIDARTAVGASFSVSQNELEGVGPQADQQSRFYNLSLTLSRVFTDDFDILIQAGPAWVEGASLQNAVNEIDTARFQARGEAGEVRFLAASSCPEVSGAPVLDGDCGTLEPPLNSAEANEYLGPDNIVTVRRAPGDDPSSSEGNLTYFANIVINKGWGEYWDTSLSYRRQEASSFSQFGSSTVADIVSATAVWEPTARWTFRATASWVKRSQEAEQALSRLVVSGVTIDRCFPAGTIFGIGVLNQDVCGGIPGFADFGDRTDVAASTALITQRENVQNEQDQLLFSLRSTYRWSDSISFAAGFNYRTQSFETAVPREDLDRWRITFGVNYRFDPIRL